MIHLSSKTPRIHNQMSQKIPHQVYRKIIHQHNLISLHLVLLRVQVHLRVQVLLRVQVHR